MNSLTSGSKKVREYTLNLRKKEVLRCDQYDNKKLKDDMLFIYEKILAGPIKAKNRKVVRAAIKKLV